MADKELETRTWLLATDDSVEQTKKVVDLRKKIACGKHDEGPFIEKSKIVKESLKILDLNLEVIVPFAENIDIPLNNVRARRDIDKILGLIQISTLLHQKQRPTIDFAGKKSVVALPQDGINAFVLGQDHFYGTLSGLFPRLEEALSICAGLEEKGIEITSSKLVSAMNISQSYARELLSALSDRGFLYEDEEKSQVNKKVYRFVQRAYLLSSVLSNSSITKWEESTKEFLERFSIGIKEEFFNYIHPITGEKIAFTVSGGEAV